MLSRNQAQEKMMTSIYTYLFNQKNNNEEDIKKIIEDSFEEEFEEIKQFKVEKIRNDKFGPLMVNAAMQIGSTMMGFAGLSFLEKRKLSK